MIKPFFVQLQFLSRIPVPFIKTFSADDFARGIVGAPLAGLLIGVVPAASFYFFAAAGLYSVAAIAAVLLLVALTGALHLDGLADTADGFGSYRSRERILEIMKDSRIGTHGAVSLVLILLVKYAVLSSFSSKFAALYLLAVPAAARMGIVWCAGVSKYARAENGMGKTIVERSGVIHIIAATIIAGVIVAALFRFRLLLLSALIIATSALIALVISLYSYTRIGGVTGDVIGAVVEIGEALLFSLLLVVESVPSLHEVFL